MADLPGLATVRLHVLVRGRATNSDQTRAKGTIRCLNIASLITPATLSVQSVSRSNSSLIQVPKFSFTTLNFVAGMQQNAGLNDYSRIYDFNGPSQPVQRIANAVAGIGQILPIAPPAPNTSWTLPVWAPAMQCSEVTGSERHQIWLNIWNSIGSDSGANCQAAYAYLAWTPCATDPNNATLQSTMPFSSGSGGSGFCGNGTLGFVEQPTALYIATLPALASARFDGNSSSCDLSFPSDDPKCNLVIGSDDCYCPYQNTTDLNQKFQFTVPNDTTDQCPGYAPADFFKDATLTSCTFFNTSISIDFAYPDGLQDIKVREVSTPKDPVVQSAFSVAGPAFPNVPASYPGNDSDCSVLAQPSIPSGVTISYDSYQFGWPNCTFDPSIARQLSYQGIISAFNSLVIGYGAFKNTAFPGLGINVLNTVLVDTVELAFLRTGTKLSTPSSQGDMTDLQHEIMNGTQRLYRGLADDLPRGTRGNIRTALEDLFQNFTISLLAEPYLQ